MSALVISRHRTERRKCPLSANSGHAAAKLTCPKSCWSQPLQRGQKQEGLMVGRSSPFGEKPFPKTVAEVGYPLAPDRRSNPDRQVQAPIEPSPQPARIWSNRYQRKSPRSAAQPRRIKMASPAAGVSRSRLSNELGKPYAAKSYEGDGGRVRSRSLLRWREEFPWLWAIDIGKAASKTWAIWSTDWRTWQDGHL